MVANEQRAAEHIAQHKSTEAGVSSNFTKQLCASVAREWWQQEALRTAEALDQLARERMFESTWGSGRHTRFCPLGGTAVAAEQKDQRNA